MEIFKEMNGRCPLCGGANVNVLENFGTGYRLDADGNPMYINYESYKLAGYCIDCDRFLYALPNRKGASFTVYPYEGLPVLNALIANTLDEVTESRIAIREDIPEDTNCNPFMTDKEIPLDEKTTNQFTPYTDRNMDNNGSSPKIELAEQAIYDFETSEDEYIIDDDDIPF